MQDYLKYVCEAKQDVNNLFNALGVKVENIDQDACILRLPIKPLLLQGAQKVAGGIIATMADEAMAHCVISGLEEGRTTATIEMNIRYLRGISKGELVAYGRVLRRGRTIVTTEAEVKDGDGLLLATAGASFWVG